MDIKTRYLYNFVIFFSLIVGAVILFFNKPDRFIVLLIYALYSTVLIIHVWKYCIGDRPRGKYLMIAAMILASFIQYFDNTSYNGFYILILVSNVLFIYEARFSVPFALLSFSAFILMLLYKTHGTYTMNTISQLPIFPRIIVIMLILNARRNIKISVRNKQLAESLQEKTVALEAALAKLAEYADELEKTADIRARETLMKELHDKLGHILATASFGTQAAIILLDKDVEDAKTRLQVITQQIQEAMQYLRKVITGNEIEKDEDEAGLTQSLINLINNTKIHTGLTIDHNLSLDAAKDFDEIPVKKRVFIYYALMEGLTNGIRHGKASKFEFSLSKYDNNIYFKLHNNGKSFKSITLGYGLSKMFGDAARFGAQFDINGKDGCTLEICLPVEHSS